MGGASYVVWRVLWRCFGAPLAWGEGGFARPVGCAFPLSGDSRLAAAGGGLRLHHSPPSSPGG